MAEMVTHRFVKNVDCKGKTVAVVECGSTNVSAVAYYPENVTCPACRVIDAEDQAYFEKDERERQER